MFELHRWTAPKYVKHLQNQNILASFCLTYGRHHSGSWTDTWSCAFLTASCLRLFLVHDVWLTKDQLFRRSAVVRNNMCWHIYARKHENIERFAHYYGWKFCEVLSDYVKKLKYCPRQLSHRGARFQLGLCLHLHFHLIEMWMVIDVDGD